MLGFAAAIITLTIRGGHVLHRSRVLSMAVLCAVVGGPLSTAPAFAQTPPAQNVPAASAPVTGLVTDTSGTPVAGATITLTGPQSYTATSDAHGQYTVPAVVPGIYTVTVTRAGFQTGREDDFAVVAGTPASVNVVTTQAFIDQGQLQVRNVLNEQPGLVISLPATSGNGAAPGAITFPNIRGGLSFETASLIDGHPVSVGAYGDYVTTFLSPYVLGSIELVKGPGALAPEVNYAIGGTVNFRTLDPTRTPSGYETFGIDSFGGQFSNVGYSNTFGKLGEQHRATVTANDAARWSVVRVTALQRRIGQ